MENNNREKKEAKEEGEGQRRVILKCDSKSLAEQLILGQQNKWDFLVLQRLDLNDKVDEEHKST